MDKSTKFYIVAFGTTAATIFERIEKDAEKIGEIGNMTTYQLPDGAAVVRRSAYDQVDAANVWLDGPDAGGQGEELTHDLNPFEMAIYCG